MMPLDVRPLTPDDRDWVREVVARDWGSPLVISHALELEIRL
jgi:hypothetical protein